MLVHFNLLEGSTCQQGIAPCDHVDPCCGPLFSQVASGVLNSFRAHAHVDVDRIFLCMPRVCQSELTLGRLTKPFREYLQLAILCAIVTQVSQVILPNCQGDTINELQ